jgi:hypothetical protein
VVTLSHTSFSPGQSINFSVDDGEVEAAAGSLTGLSTGGPEDGDWDFTTATNGGSSGGGNTGGASTYAIELLSPNSGSFKVNDLFPILWETSGSGTINLVDIFYSLNGGATYIQIADNTTNDGSFDWIVPDVSTVEGRIKVVATDLATDLASDFSDAHLTFVGTATTPKPVTPVKAPDSGNQGKSPVTGLLEPISVVQVNTFIKSPSFSTVYYVDVDMKRHPVPDAKTYFTWRESFNSVITVTDATLPTMMLGVPLLPKPGVVLVKIQSVNKVYAIVTNPADGYTPILRWIKTEELAKELYGDDWADYIIDISPSMLSRFIMGEDVLTAGDIVVNRGMMRKRFNLKAN